MKSKIALLCLAGVASAVLSACATIPGPGDDRVSARAACGDERARRKCVPDRGADFYLDDENFSIPLLADGRPNVLMWLGTLQRANNLTGEPGTPCSNSGATPFRLSDVAGFAESEIPEIYKKSRRAVKTVDISVSATLKADLIAALAQAGVPAAVIDRLDASLDATVSRAQKATFEVEGAFRQYQLRSDLLNQLDAPAPPAAYAECIGMLRSGDWQMYEALTGWQVTRATMSSETIDGLTADLVARVAAAEPTVDIAALKANITAKVTTAITTSEAPHFLIVGLSYWQPIRHPMPAMPRRRWPF